MSNPNRGDVRAGRHVLKMSVDAICDLEDLTGLTLPQIAIEMQDIAKVGMKRVRQLIFVAMKAHQPEVTLEEAGEAILEMGGQIEAINKFAEALRAAMPAPKEGQKGQAQPGPRRRTRSRPGPTS